MTECQNKALPSGSDSINIMSLFFRREMSLCAKGRMTHILSPFCYLSFPLHLASLSQTQIVFQAISESAKSRIGTLCPSSSSGHPSGVCDPCAIVLAACLLADTSNNPEIWPPSNLITAPATIDPAPEASPLVTLPSRALFLFLPNGFLFHLLLLFVSHSLSFLSLSPVVSPSFLSERGDSVGTCSHSFLYSCRWQPWAACDLQSRPVG